MTGLVVAHGRDSRSNTYCRSLCIAATMRGTCAFTADYADIGITGIMPTTGLCRIGAVPEAGMRSGGGLETNEKDCYAA